MKYRLRGESGIECEIEPVDECVSRHPWVSVYVSDEHLHGFSFRMPKWLFEKQWEAVGEAKEDGLPAFGSGCPKCGGYAASVRYHSEVTEKHVEAFEARAGRLLEAGSYADLRPMVCEEHLAVTCSCGYVYLTRTRDRNQGTAKAN